MKYTYSILQMQLRGTPDLKETGKQPSFQTVAGKIKTYVNSIIKCLLFYLTLVNLKKM